ncbi:hypothetical protein SAMN05444503_105169 [Pseudomonas sp. BS3767]|uniref:hypothetical protein n=1 Tax=Pseudomonas TaxID=286 RepID=UPI000888C0C7|nr:MULTISPECIES: hypothetical protein [Pseudomonas]NAP01944.1 hypothetical protein [Pseudomonas syringae]NAP22467.1 hypothetical protein [Pseudomonas syringae]NAP48536.1 hypothetical protein [Pseudomonas syringae]NAP82522.1 hypothetical protein [Pseudomonas syringae]NAQ13518.1 hypothetical protein [Pseudomonas syringae]
MALKLKNKEAADTAAKWFDFDKETKVLLVSLDNTEYQIAMERMRRRVARNDAQFQEGDIGIIQGEKTEYVNHCLAIASFLLKDWTGAVDDEGNEVKYTAHIGAQMLEDNVELFMFVLKYSGELAISKKEEQVETLEKPLPASSGKASGRGQKQKSAS